ncbi:MAG: sulfide/dihydroorotate dehydrogenase-like FAD/NAD-binding protein [Deltaproteobacteria bacterium]|uniref:Sulfide/dihydroorotate dehydrogenase-like FAD/NAD-binding protein n=1 Tax=Candidatus Acidulodesulfobacterium acidiphilum TaxID=2597224 RepID=A0A520XF30_9DELT|nr:sulfide/dihydroorotate dehydrogenase-like FAD/NAD-binding protein [Deltaproteobacteria bacterium]RZV39793.1 MAG: sulfide/dihydroorotate dehydrogenase-like FAD/NAD-binding protein [Candidatus Acidulodesulfobacterium acidiphilum]
MYQIIGKKNLGEGINLYNISAPDIALKALPGQFIILRVNKNGERIPITIASSDKNDKTITILVQTLGKTTHLLSELNVGESLVDLVGPLGVPTEIKKFGTVVCIGGGFGTAAIYPIAKAMKAEGNHVISIIGARNKELLLMEDEMKSASSEVLAATNDGSYGTKGIVTDVLRSLIYDKKIQIDRVIAIGPVIMMKAVSDLTKEKSIKTIVSLNPIMIDGTGMCGACRVLVGNKTKFACVDGPDFDGHLVDFDNLMNRLKFYKEEEKTSYDCHMKAHHNLTA